MNRFRLAFPPSQIPRLAARYSKEQTDAAREEERRLVDRMGPAIRHQGHVQEGQLRVLAIWKSPRILPRVRNNSASLVEETTRAAFSAQDEHLRIGTLMVLDGVGYPVASVILHFGHRDSYPVLDFRALESLGVARSTSYTFEFWWAYVTACRKLAAKHCDGDMRMLDRALWQWSKTNQGDGVASGRRRS